LLLNGFEGAKEPNYWPMKTLEIDRQRDATKTLRNFTQRTLEGMGIWKERTNAKNAILLEDAFQIMYRHIEHTSAYVGLTAPLRNAKMLLQSPKFIDAVTRNYDKEYIKTLEDYIKAIEGEVHDMATAERLTLELMNKLDLAILGANPFVMLKQPVSYILFTTEIDAKYVRKGITTQPDYDEIRAWSPQLSHRLKGNVTRELGEIGRVGAGKRFFTGRTALSGRVMDGIRKFDYATVGRGWNIVKIEAVKTIPEFKDVKLKGSKLMPDLKGEQLNKFMTHVTKRAEEVIRLTQPTFLIKDRSAIGRSPNPFVRIMTKYTSQRNKNRNILKRAQIRYDASPKTLKDKARLMKTILTVLVVSSLMINMIDELRNRLYGRDNRTILQHVVATIGNAMSYVYFVGDVFTSIASKVEKGGYGGYGSFMSSNPIASFLDNAERLIADTIKAIDSTIEGGRLKDPEKWNKAIGRLFDDAFSVVSKYKGIPYDSISKMLKGVWRIIGGEEEEPSGRRIII
jgi:hypothetical protein